MQNPDIHSTIEAVWRIESAKLIAALARRVRDVGLAEEIAQDAFTAALEQWPQSGVPQNPGAWLMGAAKNIAVDRIRRNKTLATKLQTVAHDFERKQNEENMVAALDAKLDDDFGDDLLRLIFTACHPALAAEARVALTLRLLGGLTTEEIARAFLVPEPTIAQRITRAKKTLAEKQIPFEVPRGDDRDERLNSVLEVLYLIFNEGYTATAGGDWHRPALCEEALRLGRILANLTPDESEVLSLVAFMEIQASRSRARIDSAGNPILLLDQDRAKWDQLLIRRGLAALDRAASFNTLGPYYLQASIAACHARAPLAEKTNWQLIAALYAQLYALSPSPIIQLNRAVAVSMAEGPAAALAIIDELKNEPALKNYHLLPAVRADLLFKLSRLAEAKTEFERAASMTQNQRERTLLLSRASQCQ